MRYPLPSLICLLLVLGLATVAPAQTWQPSILETGVPKPQRPRLPTPGNLADDQQTRIRAQNRANLDEVDYYNAQQAQRNQFVEEAKQDFANIERERREQAEFNVQFEARNKPQYEAAYQVLAQMLAGRRPASLPLAVFVVENSYAAGELSYATFKADLDELATICRGLATDTSPTARFMALHRLMTDTVQVSYAGKVVSKLARQPSGPLHRCPHSSRACPSGRRCRQLSPRQWLLTSTSQPIRNWPRCSTGATHSVSSGPCFLRRMLT